MERLTLKDLEKLDTTYCSKNEYMNICEKAIKECIEYKKIEEELGIGLITFFDEIKDTRIEEFIREIIATIKRRKENEHRT